MNPVWAIDFGSTYTKVVVIDLEGENAVAIVQKPSTVETDVTDGLRSAFETLKKEYGLERPGPERMICCSSAAGGLRMVVAGLVRELTTKAAKEACLGAGARLEAAYSNGLIKEDVAEMEHIAPDIILLTGGTDGGDAETLVHNARIVAGSKLDAPVILAGNRQAADRAASFLAATGKYAVIVENVMPELNLLNVEPTRKVIRDIFMARIIDAKGMGRARELIGHVAMPTPMAVLKAAALLADGAEGETGLGDLMVIDIGGATTDVHSVSNGTPSMPDTIVKGLPEPYCKRTVEGDLGLRYNASSILEVVGQQRIMDFIPPNLRTGLNPQGLGRAVEDFHRKVWTVPASEQEMLIDTALACAAADVAVGRHAGVIEEVYRPLSRFLVQRGKDLTSIKNVIGTGGIFAYGRHPRRILGAGLLGAADPFSLRPKQPNLYVDTHYIMFAMGLLAERHPGSALRIMKRSLREIPAEGS